jgi:hypothetical protein
MNQVCDLCNGDGYKIVTKADWEAFQQWIKDPSEEKLYAPTNFPNFLTTMRTLAGTNIQRNQVEIICPFCCGQKHISKHLTLDDLKKVLT